LVVALAAAGCDTIQGRNAAGGAVTGAADGALLGASLSMGHPAGVFVGGVVGAAGGAMAASATTPAGSAARPIAVAATRPVPPAQSVAVSPPPPLAAAPRPGLGERPAPMVPERFARDDSRDPGDYQPYRPARPWAAGPYERAAPPGYDPDDWSYRAAGPALGYAPGAYAGYAPFPPRPRPCPEWAYDYRGNPVCVY
jgi:hypothetical protein